jgi:hypothetical protein
MNNYSIRDIQFLFHRSLSDAGRRSLTDFNKTVYSDEDIIEKIPYDINKYGYRFPEFKKNNEVLVLGCSQTYGSGMHNEFTWPDIFSNSIGKEYSRVAAPGDSIGAQVYKAFKYFEEIGNPKVVVGLFPLYRLEYISVPGKFISSIGSGNMGQQRPSVGIGFFYQDYFLKLSKAPHDPEYIIPKEFVLFYNFMFLKMLEQYCESHNIKFIWSIYDYPNIEDDMGQNKDAFKNYLKTFDLLEICHLKKIEECSLNKKKHCATEFKDHSLYANGSDYVLSQGRGHWGIHLHNHIAQRFIERYMEIKND